MSDATPTTPVPDQIVSLDVDSIGLHPIAQTIFYRFRLTWQSGAVTYREGTVGAQDFTAVAGAFLQATPRKKFLNALVAAGYETNLTVN